jgi:hypothetical protein
MKQVSGDPLPSIAEADAVGEIADLYVDIRQTLDMSFVNLVWRVLAAVPGGLAYSWGSMKPLYESGLSYAEARALEEGLDLPSVPRWPDAVLRGVGIDADAERLVRAAVDGYRRGNPLNTVTFSALLVRLRGETPSDEALLPRENAPGKSPYGKAPPLMNFDTMSETSAALVRAVNLLGADEEAAKVQVSLPRNLAPWPGFLSLYWTLLAPLHEDGRLRAGVEAVLSDGYARGRRLAAHLGPVADAKPETIDGVKEVLENLVPNAMGRMIPVVALLTAAMPEES